MKSLAIFDLDGTLLNTIDDLGNSCNHALRSMGFPTHALMSYPMMVGNGITRLIERALPDEARTPEIINSARRLFVDHYNDHCCDATVPSPSCLPNSTNATSTSPSHPTNTTRPSTALSPVTSPTSDLPPYSASSKAYPQSPTPR
jgi:hypothetical protein